VSAPMLGAIADYTGAKKRFLFAFAALGVVFTSLLALVGKGDWLMASLFFILGNAGFSGSIIVYESLLPHICRPDDIDRDSSKGFAIGYLGGGLLLALNLAWILKPKMFGLANSEVATRVSFLSAGMWWAVFSIPLLRRAPEPAAALSAGRSNPVRAGVERLILTFRNIREHKELTKFLLAFWLYSDGIGTVIRMATAYGTEIGIGRNALMGALLLVQFVGIPCTIAFGYIARPLGTKRAIFLALGIYCLVSVGGYFMTKAWHFWLLALVVASAQGGAQALSRSLFARMVPKARSAEFFGFYSVSSKFAGVFGPFLFAVVGDVAGTSRLSIISLLVFFIGGALLLSRVNVEEGFRVAAGKAQA
ncbi:MAG: MFS transporter, partial [Candidatus Lindowbacteria bacterium]|nr:MFS transporter [Candidatus Lindowbacteria bacterium]